MILITWWTGFLWKELVSSLDTLGIKYIVFSWNLEIKEDIKKYFYENTITKIIHLVWKCDWDLDTLMHANMHLTVSLIEVAKLFSVKQIIYASSWAVYWRSDDLLSHENDICTPNTDYGTVKKMTEDFLLKQWEQNNISIILLRFSHIYWEDRTQWVIYHFLKWIKERREITLHGDGTQVRNFVHVSDAVQSIIQCLHLGLWVKGIFNIWTQQHIDINTLIRLMEEKYDFKIKKLPSNNDLKYLCIDISKAKKILWFEPKYKTVFL